MVNFKQVSRKVIVEDKNLYIYKGLEQDAFKNQSLMITNYRKKKKLVSDFKKIRWILCFYKQIRENILMKLLELTLMTVRRMTTLNDQASLSMLK